MFCLGVRFQFQYAFDHVPFSYSIKQEPHTPGLEGILHKNMGLTLRSISLYM